MSQPSPPPFAADPGGAPVFPPLLTGMAAPGAEDLLAAASQAACDGADGGTVLWSPTPHPWRAAIVLAPEAALRESLSVVLALQLAVIDAIGALAPPEVGITWAWPDVMLANGAVAGRMRVAASSQEPDETPDWLAAEFSVDLAPLGAAPGETPDRTTLAEEGCPDLSSNALTEVWARNALLWLHRWGEAGLAAAAPQWRERAYGAALDDRETSLILPLSGGGAAHGRFLGIDDHGGLLLRSENGAVSNPSLLEVLPRADLNDPARLSPANAHGSTSGSDESQET